MSNQPGSSSSGVDEKAVVVNILDGTEVDIGSLAVLAESFSQLTINVYQPAGRAQPPPAQPPPMQRPDDRWDPGAGALALAWESSHPDRSEARYYAVWNCPGLDRSHGVHVGFGLAAYNGLVRAAGGFGGIRWKRCDSMEAALSAYIEESIARKSPAKAIFKAW